MLRPLSLSFERSLAARSPENALTEVRRTFAGLQEQMATGRRVNRPSDDPTAFEQARTWEAHAERLDGHLRAVSAARLWTSHTAEALDGLVELTMTAHEHGVRGRNDSLSDADREALALRIDSLLEEAVDRLNGQVEGEYLFAGNQTGTEPFAADGTPNAGDFSGLRVRRIGPGVDLAVNVPGDRVQHLGNGQTATGALRALADALRGSGDFETALADVAAARDHFIALAVENGEVRLRLDEAEAQLDAAALLAERHRADLEDTDLFAAASEAQRAQSQLEATLQTIAAIRQRSLLDYLR